MAVPFCQIPVIMLSSSEDCNDIMEAYALVASPYLVKPTTFDGWLISRNYGPTVGNR
ncbi:hypothetical protein GCM10028819_44280 [Spirosoma humi]